MFDYQFMRYAVLAGLMLGLIIPLLGSTTVFKRLSLSGDALAHTSLAGVAIGLAAGLNPLVISMVSCVVAFMIIELFRKKFQKYSELGVAIVLSAGIGLAGLISSFVSATNFDSYLFGSIILIDGWELWLIGGISVAVVVFYALFYRQIFAAVYSEDEAKANGVKTNWVNLAQAFLTAVAVALSAKTIGSLVVSSLMVIPVAASLQVNKSYRGTLLFSVVISLASVMAGLTISYYAGLRPGATIVMVSIAVLILIMLGKGGCHLVQKALAKTKGRDRI